MKISETYRSVLVLRHYEDLKFREIAEVLGIPEGTVKSRMAEGLSPARAIVGTRERRRRRRWRVRLRVRLREADGKELLVL